MPRTRDLAGSVMVPDIAAAYRDTGSAKQQDRYGPAAHSKLVEYYRAIVGGGDYNGSWPTKVLGNLGGGEEAQVRLRRPPTPQMPPMTR